jgi:hypothetical protein
VRSDDRADVGQNDTSRTQVRLGSAPWALAADYGSNTARVAGRAPRPSRGRAARHFRSRILTYQDFTAPFSSELLDARDLEYITYT